MAQDTFVDVRGLKLHVQRAGKGEPLLFLHGAQGLSGQEPGLEALALDFDVICARSSGLRPFRQCRS